MSVCEPKNRPSRRTTAEQLTSRAVAALSIGHRQSTKTHRQRRRRRCRRCWQRTSSASAATSPLPPSSALAFRRLAPFRILVHLPAFCSDSCDSAQRSSAAFLRKYATPPPPQLTTTHKSYMHWRMQRSLAAAAARLLSRLNSACSLWQRAFIGI